MLLETQSKWIKCFIYKCCLGPTYSELHTMGTCYETCQVGQVIYNRMAAKMSHAWKPILESKRKIQEGSCIIFYYFTCDLYSSNLFTLPFANRSEKKKITCAPEPVIQAGRRTTRMFPPEKVRHRAVQ